MFAVPTFADRNVLVLSSQPQPRPLLSLSPPAPIPPNIGKEWTKQKKKHQPPKE